MLAIPERIDSTAGIGEFVAQALRASAGGERDYDLSGLRYFDSSALALLLAVQRAAGESIAHFHNPPVNLRKLAALYGIDALLFGAPVAGEL